MSARGYCQECGGEYAVFGEGTRVARHGFSRHHGRECPGSRKAPAEDNPCNCGHDGCTGMPLPNFNEALSAVEAERDAALEREERLRSCLLLSSLVIGSIDAQALDDLESGWARIQRGESTLGEEMHP